jgi:hypothetical protein
MTHTSLDEILLIDKKLAEKPIQLPDHPIVTTLKDFGVDELLAAGVDIVATGIAGSMIKGPARMAVLPFVGPVLEKGIFLARHAYDAQKIYKTTPEHLRQSRRFYFKEGLKHGSVNLLKDVTIHDPIYSLGVLAGLYFLPDVPPFILSSLSYAIGVVAVAGIDVAKNEFKFKKFKNNLVKEKFYSETYWESRFMIRGDKRPQEVMDQLSREFNLTPRGAATFEDTYMQNVLPNFNGRSGKIRFRARGRREHEKDSPQWGPNSEAINTLQIIYSRAKSNGKKNGLDQFNYYPIEKTKLCLVLEEPATSMETSPDDAKKIVGPYVAPEPHYRRVLFERSLWDSKDIAICTDTVRTQKPYYLLELKVFEDMDLLQQVMRYVMLECPVVALQTTQGKGDLFI